jgi:hypothetical protein
MKMRNSKSDNMPMMGKPHPHRCLIHGMWKRKGNCELCIMEQESIRKQYEQTGGVKKPPIVIRKI